MIKETPDFNNRCYKTKDDKRHNTAHIKMNLTDEQWDQIKSWRKTKEEFKKEVNREVDCPHVGLWNPEWTVLSVGKRMTKNQLKEYCKRKGKDWIN